MAMPDVVELIKWSSSEKTVLLAGLLAGRCLPLVVESHTVFVDDPDDVIIQAVTELQTLPLTATSRWDVERLWAVVQDWFDPVGEEPEGQDFWVYEGMVLVESLLKVLRSSDKRSAVSWLCRVCADLAENLDRRTDCGDHPAESAEYEYWRSASKLLAASDLEANGYALIDHFRKDQTRVLSLVQGRG